MTPNKQKLQMWFSFYKKLKCSCYCDNAQENDMFKINNMLIRTLSELYCLIVRTAVL